MKMSLKYMLAVPALAIALSVLPACGDDSNNSPSTSVGTGGAVTTGVATTGATGRPSVAPMDASDIDLVSTAAFADGHPWEQYAWLRANAPVFRHPYADG